MHIVYYTTDPMFYVSVAQLVSARVNRKVDGSIPSGDVI